MATKEAVFKLRTDTSDSIKDVKDLDKNMSSLADTINVEVSSSISVMEDKLYDLALAGEQNTKEFKDLQAQVSKYKQVIIETDRSVDQLAEQGRGLSTALSLAEGTVAGFQAFTGITALMGTENEELLETITKLQAAQGVLNSIEIIKQQIQANSIKLTQTQTAVQNLLNKAIGNGTKATKLLRGALIATGIGALIVGVGLLIANWEKLTGALRGTTKAQELNNEVTASAIEKSGEELNAIDKLTKKVNDENLSRNQKMFAIAALQKEYPHLLSNIDAENASLEEVNRALEANTKLTILKAKQDAIAELRVEEFKKQIQAQTDAQTGANQSWTSWILSAQNSEAALALHNAEQQEAIRNTEEQIGALDNLTESIEKEIAATERSLGQKAERGRFDKINEERSKKYADEAAKRAEERQRLIDEENRILGEQFALQEEIRQMRLTADELEEQKIADKFDGMIERAHGNAELEKQLIIQQEAELTALFAEREQARADIEQAYLQQRLDANRMIEDAILANKQEGVDKEIELLNTKYARELEAVAINEALNAEEKMLLTGELEIAQQEEINRIKEDYRQRDLDAENAAQQQKIDNFNSYTSSISQGLDSIASISDSVTQIQLANAEGNEKKQEAIQKKSFERNKKIQIALATINTIQGVINALTAQSVIPEPFGTILKAVNAVAVGAAGVANIAKIKSQKFKGGGGGSPSIPRGGAGASAGALNIANTSSSTTQLNPDGTPKSDGESEPLKVYVTESDISNTQNRVQQTEVRSTF